MAAAPVKTLRYILPAAEASLDPAQGRDLYTGHITEAIFETLYTYDYLARPVRLARRRRQRCRKSRPTASVC
jgi:ABC-type oligopeptide transport system substrate-binding subunit